MNDPNAENYHELNIRELKEYFDKQNKMPLKDRVKYHSYVISCK